MCAKWTLGVLRTGTLLAGAVFASMLMVDPPLPAGLAGDARGGAEPYVPASDRWIELGAPQNREAASPRAHRLEADLRAAQGGSLRPSS
jgi:hypothetical protein